MATTWSNDQASTDGPSWSGQQLLCEPSWASGVESDVWFTWTPAAGTHAAVFSLCTPNPTTTGVLNSDNKIVVYDTTSCGGLAPGNVIACDDDSCVSITFGLQAVCTGFVTPGQTYLIQAGSFGPPATGVWDLEISPTARPVANLACRPGAGPDDYVVEFDYPPGAGPGDTVVLTSTEIGVGNPLATLSYPASTFAATLLPANQGLSQMFEVAAVYNHGGMTSEPATCFAVFYAELRDECVDALLIGSGDVDFPFDNFGATNSPEPTSCFPASPPLTLVSDLWGSYVATELFTTISFLQTSGQERVAILYQGCHWAAGGQAIGCKRLLGQEELKVPTVPGEMYSLRVGSVSASGAGPSVLQIRATPPTPDDECFTAPVIGTGTLTVTITTVDATDSDDPAPQSCGVHHLGPFHGDVWYRWIADDHRAYVEWERQVDLLEPVLVIYDSCGSAAVSTALLCSEEPDVAAFSLMTVPGQTYWLRLGSSVTPHGTGELRITTLGPLPNDECATATALGSGAGDWNINNLAATNSLAPAGPCPSQPFATGFLRDIFYSWIADDETAHIEWSGGAPGTHPKLAVYLTCSAVSLGNTVDCHAASDPFPATLTLPTTPGVSYILRIGEHGLPPWGGFGTLSITTAPALVNDECASATSVGTGNQSVTVDLTDASTSLDPLPNVCDSASVQRDLWYAWQAHTPFIQVRWEPLSPPGPSFAPSLALYSSCLDASVGVALECASEILLPLSLSTIPVTVGQTYLFRVGQNLGSPGTGVLEIHGEQVGPPGLVCVEGPAPGEYELSWTPPPAVIPGDTFVVRSNEPGVANPIAIGTHGVSAPFATAILLPTNQGFPLSVTFTVEYTTTIGVGSTECVIHFEQVPGDHCLDAIAIGAGEVASPFDWSGSTPSLDPFVVVGSSFCGFYLEQDLWLEWTADWSNARIDVSSQYPISATIAVYESCALAGVGTAVACGMNTCFAGGLNPGATYLIRVGRGVGGAVPATLTITDIVALVPSFTCEPEPPQLQPPGAPAAPGALLRWTWPQGAAVGDLVEIVSDEPGVANPALVVPYPNETAVYRLLPANAPLTVEFELFYSTGPASSFFGRRCSHSFGRLSYDNCGTALPLSGPLPIAHIVQLALATPSAVPDPSYVDCGNPTSFNEDAWISWTATVSATRIRWSSDTLRDPTLAIYESCADAVAGLALACNDGHSYEAEFDVNLVPGQTYWIRVANHESSELGDGLLEIEDGCVPPSNVWVNFDCPNQVVVVSWTENADYLALELLVNGVPVANPPAPAGAGATSSYVDMAFLPNTTMTYQLRAHCPGGGVVVSGERRIDVVVPAGIDNLILTPWPSWFSGDGVVKAELLAGQHSFVQISDQNHGCLDQLISEARNIWVLNHDIHAQWLTAATGDRIYQAVRNGKNVFLQGTDYWFHHTPSGLDLVDGVDDTDVDNGDDSMNRMRCFDGTLTQLGTQVPVPLEYFRWQWTEDTDVLTVATPASDPGILMAEAIHRNTPDPGEDDFVVGTIALTTSGALVVTNSFELTGLLSGAAASAIAAEYIELFSQYPKGFRRGDCNNDGSRNSADVAELLQFVVGSSIPDCVSACDVSDDGQIDIADVVLLLNNVFGVTSPPLWLPPDSCGPDPTPDPLTCLDSVCP